MRTNQQQRLASLIRKVLLEMDLSKLILLLTQLGMFLTIYALACGFCILHGTLIMSLD